MNCDKCKELMWEYLSDELEKEDAALVASHIKDCPVCQKEAEKLQEIMDSLNNLPEEELPKGYHSELMNKLTQEKNVVPLFPEKKKKYIWKQLGVIAAGVVLVAAIGGTQGILKMRGGQDAPLPKMAAQKNEESNDISVYSAPQEENSALSKQDVLQDSSEKGTGKPEIQQKRILEEPPQDKIASDISLQKESAKQEEAQSQEDVGNQAEMQAKADFRVQDEEMSEPPLTQERGLLFAADTGGEETQVQQQVILSVDTTEGVLDRIRDLTISLGGYEELRLSGETVRIFVPADQTEKFLEGLKEIGETRSIVETSETMGMIVFEITLETN